MALLFHLSGASRWEDDEGAIAELALAGWVVQPAVPEHNAATHRAVWRDLAWVIEAKTAQEMAADTRRIWPSSAKFLAEFTLAETVAIALSADGTVAALRLILAAWDGQVWSDDSRIQAGMAQLVTLEVISQARSDSILTRPD